MEDLSAHALRTSLRAEGRSISEGRRVAEETANRSVSNRSLGAKANARLASIHVRCHPDPGRSIC